MRPLRSVICWLVGHRDLRRITEAELLEVSIDGPGLRVTGHRWDCARCGSRGIKAKGYSR